MHCANLDTPVKGAIQSSQRLPQLAQNTETKEEENSRILKCVLDAGILILEGRLPEPTSKRGYVEGPHCVLHPQTQAHQCDSSRYMCKRSEKYRQLISSLWNECKGICIELRVCADCSCGQEQVWKNTSTNFDYILEQWYFEMTNVRNEDEDLGNMNWYGLMQAIRSQIHFSQLSAWWSSNRAQLPKNITYHVLPLIQADVNRCSLQHKFPVLSFTTTYLQVKLRSQPRSETLPNVRCPVHCNKDDVVDDRMKILCDRFGKHHCQAVEDSDENDNRTWCEKHKRVDDVHDSSSSSAAVRVKMKNYKNSGKKCAQSVKLGHNARNNETRIRKDSKIESRMSRNGCSSRSELPFVPSNHKNIVNSCVLEKKPIYSRKPTYVSIHSCDNNRTKFDQNNGLAEETSAQFFNICNWTNTMVSSVMSKMRNGNSFLNNFSDPNAFSELFTFAKNENDKEKGELELADEKIRSNEINEQRAQELYTNAINTTFASGETNSKITSSKTKTVSCDNDFVKMDLNNAEELRKNTFRSSYKPIALQEKNFEAVKLKNFREKRFHFENSSSRKRLLPFVGNVIESVLSGRVHFTNCIENFKIKVTSGGSLSIQNCTDLPAAAYYYHFGDGMLSKSYLVKSFISENEKGIQIPNSGRLQVGIFNTEESLIKVFTVAYDLSDMPRCSKTFLRHSNYFTPKGANENNVKWLQSFLQLKCRCSKSGRLYLQSEINAIMFQKSDLNTACEFKMKTDLMHQDITEIAYKKELHQV